MRISVEIDEAIVNELMAITGEGCRSPAMAKAITEFVRRKKASEFGHLMREGAFDYPDPVGKSEDDPANPVPVLVED